LHGALVETYDSCGPLLLACMAERLDIVDMLLRHGASAVGGRADSPLWWNSPLWWAVKLGNLGIVKRLLQSGVDVTETSKDGVTLLHRACHESRSQSVLESLVRAGAPINARTTGIVFPGSTPLMTAVRSDCVPEDKVIEILDVLVRLGADVNLPGTDRMGGTPFIIACLRYKAEVAEFLLDHGADPNAVDGQGHTAMFLANEYGIGCVLEMFKRRKTRTELKSR